LAPINFNNKRGAAASSKAAKLRLLRGPDEVRLPCPVQSIFPGSEYTEEEVRFLKHVEDYKKRTGKKFPTFVEVFRLAKEFSKTP
jgi:hypothetical protein